MTSLRSPHQQSELQTFFWVHKVSSEIINKSQDIIKVFDGEKVSNNRIDGCKGVEAEWLEVKVQFEPFERQHWKAEPAELVEESVL